MDRIGSQKASTLKSIDTAIKFLFMRKKIKKENDIIVFDIDGTLVKDEKSCIASAVSFYKKCISLGYKIYIITARLFTPENYIFTVNMLTKCDILNYVGIFMRPGHIMDLHYYKASKREFLTKSGFNIVMSVGNDTFDFGVFSGVNIWIFD